MSHSNNMCLNSTGYKFIRIDYPEIIADEIKTAGTAKALQPENFYF